MGRKNRDQRIGEVAARFGVHPNTIRNRVKDHNLEEEGNVYRDRNGHLRFKPKAIKSLSETLRIKQEGYISAVQAALQLGISRHRLYRLLVKAEENGEKQISLFIASKKDGKNVYRFPIQSRSILAKWDKQYPNRKPAK